MRKPRGKIKNIGDKRALRRKLSIRRRISGTEAKPRICFIKSNKHIQVQVIDDVQAKTLFAVQTFGKNAIKGSCNKEGAKAVSAKVADLFKENKIEQAVFDRNGRKYAGILSVFADNLREQGIRF